MGMLTPEVGLGLLFINKKYMVIRYIYCLFEIKALMKRILLHKSVSVPVMYISNSLMIRLAPSGRAYHLITDLSKQVRIVTWQMRLRSIPPTTAGSQYQIERQFIKRAAAVTSWGWHPLNVHYLLLAPGVDKSLIKWTRCIDDQWYDMVKFAFWWCVQKPESLGCWDMFYQQRSTKIMTLMSSCNKCVDVGACMSNYTQELYMGMNTYSCPISMISWIISVIKLDPW